MRIPQTYKTPGWQRFLSGLILGMILGWVLFIVISGIAQERQLSKIEEQRDQIEQLRNELKTWQEDSEEKNKKLEQRLTVQQIQIDIAGEQNSKLGKLELSELKGKVKSLLSSLVKQNIEYVAANRKLVIQTIESHVYVIEKNKYRLKVKSLVIYSTVSVTVNVEKAK